MDNVFLPYRNQYKFVLLTSLGLSENFTQIVSACNKQCNQELEELQLPPNGGFCLSTIHLSNKYLNKLCKSQINGEFL